MAHAAVTARGTPVRYTSERYLRLVDEGVLGADDRVELLEGVIVSMSPHNPRHAAGVRRASVALAKVVGERAFVDGQLPLIAGPYSVPEPDAAVIPGTPADYDRAHPNTALLVLEVADSSLAQDRITKAAIYAGAGIPEYWLVDLVHDCVEVFRTPAFAEHAYGTRIVAHRGERLEIAALPGATVAVDDLLPAREP